MNKNILKGTLVVVLLGIVALNVLFMNVRGQDTATHVVVSNDDSFLAEIKEEILGEEEDTPITGNELEQASTAALAHIGKGKVTDTEVGDEEGYYEVEITVDGKEVDVHLDENFNVLSEEWD